jgi:recombination protein RecR
MTRYTESVENLIENLCGLPGIGPKSAQRIALHLLSVPSEETDRLAAAIVSAKENVRYCSVCFNITEQDTCDICEDTRRDRTVLCVVEEPRDVIAIERSGSYRGIYHVLGGAISPIDGVGPEELRFAELMGRLRQGQVGELVIATNPNAEGEATAMYLSRMVRPLGITVTRIASGLPVGGDLEYADEVTLGRALEHRTPL